MLPKHLTFFGPSATNEVVSGPNLPFETWRAIFLYLFDDPEAPTTTGPQGVTYALSFLHRRLLIFRLLWVSKYWYNNARDVFFEDLSAETADSLRGIQDALMRSPGVAGAVRRITMSFPIFRDTESQPRKPREILQPADTPDNTVAGWAWNKNLHARANYHPSETMQATHWLRWHGLCSAILIKCTSLRSVKITFTSNYAAQSNARNGRNYKSLFGAPDLRNDAILNGLHASTNLRELHFIDPTPLEAYGPGLALWAKLKTASVILSPGFSEIGRLPETTFCPPKALEYLQLHDHQSTKPWPLESDMARCTDLKALDLGVMGLDHAETKMAIGFLVASYQNTLTTLTLTDLSGVGRSQRMGLLSFEVIFTDQPARLKFPCLERLILRDASVCHSLFAAFEAHELTEVEVGVIDYLPLDETRVAEVDYWRNRLSVPSLGRVKVLKVRRLRGSTKQSLPSACKALGITIEVIQPSE
ncbi:hypothetical protein FRB94_011378 [Tulasnella sp. JGI-2019a]|nr:hypothetical protein FRB93_009996 [Tulasnella sp. JGI-2019a]KAG8992732.1 hypothetical protein FRB94_011378 [Tulasnella sp. JGI-2019a]